ncbi:MAG: NAD(P)/FAD-dependent oxidoreductase [Clostridia bacterium]|nr:NAD(P)/FAD-dependent oxidoreductase [Clostridia bacterium]
MNELMNDYYDIAVIGGGASALWFTSFLLSQIKASSNKIPSIAIIDSNNAPGKKLLMTGNGRCNVTNLDIDSSSYNTDDFDKLSMILNSFTPEDTINYLRNELGIMTVNKGSLIYPMTLKAITVNNGLVNHVKTLGADLILDTKVTSVSKSEDKDIYLLKSSDKFSIYAKYVVFAFGGASYPKTGSDGKSFSLLRGFVDKSDLVKLLPSLVQLNTKNMFPGKISGTRTSASLLLSDKKGIISCEKGEILFTDYGISGILVMQLSGIINRYFEENNRYPSLECDLLPDLSLEEAIDWVLKIKNNSLGSLKLSDSLQGILLPEIVESILDESELKKYLDFNLSDLNESDIRRIFTLLKKVKFRISSSLGFDNAQVTSGGIKLQSLTNNMELKGKENIFIIGEAVNVDGPCGGYNLQWAWSSAVQAARGIYDRL